MFDKWDDNVFESSDSFQGMIDRFKEQLAIGEINKEAAKKEKEEQKQLTQKKKDIRAGHNLEKLLISGEFDWWRD